MTSRAHELYRQITKHEDPAAFLESMITDQRTESEFLEFKGASKIQPKQVKEFWSQTLSAFANTEGGVLIWGIRAARIDHPDDPSRKIDVATAPDFVPNPEAFIQSLKDVQLEACIEPIPGVEFFLVVCDGGGFVVCLVPEGKHKPYRATLEQAKQYYQRVGDNSVVISHSLLRSLFYPTSKSLLCISTHVAEGMLHDDPEDVIFVSKLQNVGAATAREIYVSIEWPFNRGFAWEPTWNPRTRSNDPVRGMVYGHPLHPGEEVLMGHLKILRHTSDPHQASLRKGFDSDLTFHIADHAPQKVQVRYNPSELFHYREEKSFMPLEEG